MAEKTTGTPPADRDPWDDFCEQLKRAGRVMRRDTTPKDDLSLAEGYRKLVHLVRVGFEATLDFADPQHPRIYQSVTATTLGEGETSDARYHQAFIDGSATYRVTGTRGAAPLIEFTVYAGKIGLQEVSRQVGTLTERELVVARDGTFEIALSPDEHPGNWIRTAPDASLLYIRQYAHDWSETRGATFAIRREGAAAVRSPLTLGRVRAGLAATASFVDRAAYFWAEMVDRRATAPPNVFFEIRLSPDLPEMPTGHRFAAGYFRLAPDEALLVSFVPTEVPYWGIDLTSYWFEPLSYEDHRSHVNNRTAARAPDGSVRVAIASGRPRSGGQSGGRIDNWLDTLGHAEGTMLFRWSRSNDPVPQLTTRVVKLADL